MFANFIDNFRPIIPEVLECHQGKLPKSIGVSYIFDKDSKKWFAVIQLNKDVLFTEARDREKLETNVNDAVATFFDIPERYFAQISIDKKFYKDPNLLRKNKSVLVKV